MNLSRIILGFFIVLLISIIIYGLILKNLWDKISFDFNITGLDVPSISIVGGFKSTVDANIDFFINNPTSTSLFIKDLIIEGYYNGKKVAKTNNIEKIKIKPKINNLIKTKVSIFLDIDVIKLIIRIKDGKEENIKTITKFKLLGIIPIRYKYNYKINENNIS